MPTLVELQDYYAGYTGVVGSSDGLSIGSRYDMLRRLYHRISGDVDPRDFIPVTPGLRILDYGCGAAPYLHYFRSRGALVHGAEIEPSVVRSHRASGLDVALIENPETIPFPDGAFDIVYLMQVIEHVPAPHHLLREVRRILQPSGEVYLAMPNARSIWRRRFGADWVVGWFAPFHLFVFSLRSIRALAAANGFAVVRWWSSTPESWFRLNLHARLHPENNLLGDAATTWLDTWPPRVLLGAALRLRELFARERDCLVVRLRKC